MKRSGFSLIELLVTVLITSIVVIAAYQLLTSTTHSFGDEDNRRILEANLRNAELLLQRDIARTGYAYGYTADPGAASKMATGNIREHDSICRAAFIGTADLKKVAFKHRTDEADGKKYSSIQIVASISDYDDFTVSSCSESNIVLDRSVTLPLVAGQVFENNLTTQTSDDGTFQSIFSRMFRGASAIEISTPDTGTAIALIGNVESDVLVSGNTLGLIGVTCAELPAYCNIDPERPLSENTINPIISIVYRVKGGNLERCVTRVDAKDFDVTGGVCDILLANVIYFDVFPVIKQKPDQLDGGVANLRFTDEAAKGTEWQGVTIGDLSGAMFRIGATVPSSSIKSVVNKKGIYSDSYVSVDGTVRLLSHARGIAIFQSPDSHTLDGSATLNAYE